MNEENKVLELSLAHSFATLEQVLEDYQPELRLEKVGTITSVGSGIVQVNGLKGVKVDEVLSFPGNRLGMAFNLDAHETGVVMLDESEGLRAGSEVRRTGRVLDIPVGEALLGRVIDPQGRPLDNAGKILLTERRPVERSAPAIMDRAPVKVPLQTGLKVIDALIPIGRGQRELILGDRQTGKTAIAVDTIINQKDKDVICIYCTIGKRVTAVARVIATLREHRAMDYCIFVVATENAPPGVQFVSPYAATSIGEYFMEQGRADKAGFKVLPSFETQCRGQVGFAGSTATHKDDIVSLFDIITGCQFFYPASGQVWNFIKIKSLQGFQETENYHRQVHLLSPGESEIQDDETCWPV